MSFVNSVHGVGGLLWAKKMDQKPMGFFWLGQINWVVVSNMVYFHSSLGKIPILTHIFEMG